MSCHHHHFGLMLCGDMKPHSPGVSLPNHCAASDVGLPLDRHTRSAASSMLGRNSLTLETFWITMRQPEIFTAVSVLVFRTQG